MRFGFVGLGFATQWLHLPAVRDLPGLVAAGGADPAPERRQEWAALEAGPAFSTVEQLLAEVRADVVVVASPPHLHAEQCIAALEAGAHVICEKPFVENDEQAEAVLAAARRNGRFVAVNHEFRYMPIFRRVAETIGTADVGRPVFLHATQFMDLAPWNEKVPWRAAMPDRSLFEGGVHIVDLLHMLAGRLPVNVYGVTSSGLDPDRRADALHLVTLDYGGGLLGQITIDRLCPAGTRYVDLRVDCEQASLCASYGGHAVLQIGVRRAEKPGVRLDFGPEGLAWAERGLSRKVIGRNPRNATARATRALYEGAVAAFRRGEEPPTTATIARETLKVIAASYRSARTGERVAIG